MGQGQFPGVEHLPRRRNFSGTAVHGVARQRMADMTHVHPDLMGPSGEDPDFHQTGRNAFDETFPDDGVGGMGFLAVFFNYNSNVLYTITVCTCKCKNSFAFIINSRFIGQLWSFKVKYNLSKSY